LSVIWRTAVASGPSTAPFVGPLSWRFTVSLVSWTPSFRTVTGKVRRTTPGPKVSFPEVE
jgi:hypothetical protein